MKERTRLEMKMQLAWKQGDVAEQKRIELLLESNEVCLFATTALIVARCFPRCRSSRLAQWR